MAKTPGEWLKDGSFYLHGCIYMLVRLAMNLTMTVIPFYLNTVLGVPKPDEPGQSGVDIRIAIVPMVSFVASAIFSLFFYNKLIRMFGNRIIPLLIGACIISLGSLPYVFMSDPWGLYMIYACVAVQGIGLAILLNTATSLISDVIGSDEAAKASSAFVFGVYSFFDKMSSGVVLFIATSYLLENVWALRMIAGVLPIAAGFGSWGLCWLG